MAVQPESAIKIFHNTLRRSVDSLVGKRLGDRLLWFSVDFNLKLFCFAVNNLGRHEQNYLIDIPSPSEVKSTHSILELVNVSIHTHSYIHLSGYRNLISIIVTHHTQSRQLLSHRFLPKVQHDIQAEIYVRCDHSQHSTAQHITTQHRIDRLID